MGEMIYFYVEYRTEIYYAVSELYNFADNPGWMPLFIYQNFKVSEIGTW